MIELKTPGEIDAMRAAGGVVAGVLDEVRKAATVGSSLLELDEIARTVMHEARAGSSFLDYQPGFAPTPYPSVICTSVNDVMLHGIPTRYRLRDGDLLSVDAGFHLDGWHGDAATSFVVGDQRAADTAMIATAEQALAAGIAAAQPGATLGDIAHAITSVVRPAGYGMQADFAGHGIGRAMHEEPFVPNVGVAGRGFRLRPGLVVAIEPSLMAGGDDGYRVEADGWSLSSGDGSRSAHVEHTIAITENGPEVLTRPLP